MTDPGKREQSRSLINRLDKEDLEVNLMDSIAALEENADELDSPLFDSIASRDNISHDLT